MSKSLQYVTIRLTSQNLYAKILTYSNYLMKGQTRMMAKRLNAAKVSCVPHGTPAYYVRVTRAGVRHIPAIVLGDEGKKLKIRYQSSTLNIETMTNEAYTVDVGIQRKHIDICDWRIEGVRRRLLEPMVTV